MDAKIDMTGDLSAKVFRANGSIEDLGVISSAPLTFNRERRVSWRAMQVGMITLTIIVAAAVLALLLLGHWLFLLLSLFIMVSLVTNAGAAYMASDFAGGGTTPHIGGFNFHDNGTGTTAAAVTDTALQTPAGTARVAGTQTSPSTQVYRTVATISFTSGLAITEWGLFSASTSGTLWDHRVFSAINVVNGDSIQYTYNLTVNSGGT